MPIESEQKHVDVILDSIADGVFTVNEDWRITSFNRAAEEITGVPREEALGSRCSNVLHADCCEHNCALRETLSTGKPIVNRHVSIVNNLGDLKTISISTAILRGRDGRMIGGVETFRDLTVEEELRKQLAEKFSCGDIISVNHRMRELFDILPEIAASPSTVLLEGESGTGTELFARAIHSLSPRKDEAFVAVNCAALPDTLLESELFGYVAGAFTDARKDKPGRFALAEKGTIFLDEIGDVSAALQVRLLRVLQEREYEPLGSVATRKADVRVIVATNKNLGRLVESGAFRQDLYYRVNVVRIEIPPLRERMEDIPVLAEHFIRRFSRIQNKAVTGLTDDALACLMNHTYPGNVRELENFIERAFVLCRAGVIRREHLPQPISEIVGDTRAGAEGKLSFKDMEAAFLMNALRRNRWNRLATAKELGMHKTTLFRKIKSLGLKLPKRKGSGSVHRARVSMPSTNGA